MRKQIAAANWKMNLTYPQAENLLTDVLNANIELKEDQQAVFAVPSPYLIMTNAVIATKDNYFAAAQNCYNKKSGAYTGEISAVKDLDNYLAEENAFFRYFFKHSAKFGVDEKDELDHQFEKVSLKINDVKLVVLTHLHLDHTDGLNFFLNKR